MSTYLPLTLSICAILLASLSGAVFTSQLLHDWFAPRLRYLVALAAGVFVVIIMNLLGEATHEGISYGIIVAFILGGVLIDIITRILPKQAHHHHTPHPEHHHQPIDARHMLVGDAIHNVHDGIALVPAFLVSTPVGLGTAAGVLLHEVVQQLAEYFVLREAGYAVRKALLWSFVAQTSLLIGVALSLTLVTVGVVTAPLIAFSAGSFTYIVLRDLIPSIIGHARADGATRYYVMAFCAGILLMGSIVLFVPHEHAGEEFFVPEGFGIAMR